MQVRRWGSPPSLSSIRLDPGEPLFASLERATKELYLSSGFITSGLGSLKDVVLGFYQDHGYVRRRFEGPYELLSLTGSLAEVDGRPHFHLHAVLGNPEYQAFGGHLHEATVAILAEVLLASAPGLRFGRNPGGPELKVLDLWPGGSPTDPPH
jgi:predicted DNA-binding protein with PD1-like motif